MGELELCYETFGASDAAPLLLVMGLASQMILWDDEFCELLAAQGFWVIRFDNRDVGRSTIMREARIPKRWQLLARDARGAAYSLDETAADAVGLVDHLKIDAAHVVGASMGGMIAQLIAVRHPERVLSLVSIMSTTGNRRVGQPHPRTALRMLRKVARDRAGYIEDHIRTYRAIGSQRFDFEEEHKRERAGRCFDRGIHPAGSARQMAAVTTAPDRTPLLGTVRVPTTIIHGDADPLVNLSGGEARPVDRRSTSFRECDRRPQASASARTSRTEREPRRDARSVGLFGLRVGHVEVGLPVRAVARGFPATGDGAAVIAEGSVELLEELGP